MASKPKPELAQSELVAELPLACADESAARAFIEQKRWGDTPCCVHCGDVDVYRMTGETATRRGLWRCKGCKKQYTVRVGTIFEDSKIPLHQWCRVYWESATGKNGVSALEVSRRLQISYKSALFMMHRIRHAMAPDHSSAPKLSGTIEADETYVGGKPRHYRYDSKGRVMKGQRPGKPKVAVFAAVQRGGDVRAKILPSVTSANLRDALHEVADRSARLMTDEYSGYIGAGKPFASHNTVKHSSREYVNRKNPEINTNSIESFFARVKRQLNGTYHAVSKEHLHRYISHAEYLYNTRGLNDGERILDLIRRSDGKRLMYSDPNQKAG